MPYIDVHPNRMQDAIWSVKAVIARAFPERTFDPNWLESLAYDAIYATVFDLADHLIVDEEQEDAANNHGQPEALEDALEDFECDPSIPSETEITLEQIEEWERLGREGEGKGFSFI